MMKVLLINGSPHEKGCTFTALNEIKKTLESENVEAEIFHIGTNPVRGCIGCGGCAKNNGKCVFNDDMEENISKVNDAEVIIWITPTRWNTLSGDLKIFIDRLNPLYSIFPREEVFFLCIKFFPSFFRHRSLC